MGGCVRDLMLGIQPCDFDIATAASGRTVDALFFRQQARHRTPPERTLPAADDVTIDIVSLSAPPWVDRDRWRRQRKAEQASLAEAFIKSFDYTVNALYYDPAENVVIDFVNAVDDIRTRTLRLVRPAQFRLDVVTVLRGVLQSATKGLRIDDITWNAMRRWASRGSLRSRKPHRIYRQVVKTLGSGEAARCFAILERMGAMHLFVGLSARRNRELVPVRRLLEALDGACAPGLRVSVLFAALFYHPIELRLARMRCAPDDQASLSEAIDSKLRTLAEPLVIPKAVYRETHRLLVAVHLMRDGRMTQRRDKKRLWWKSAELLRAIVTDARI